MATSLSAAGIVRLDREGVNGPAGTPGGGGWGRGAPRSTARGYRWVPGECWYKSEVRAFALCTRPKGRATLESHR